MKRFVLPALIAFSLSGCIYHRQYSMTPPSDQQESVEVHVVRKSERATPAHVASMLKVTLSAAIDSALGKVKGQALNAVVEVEDGKAMIEVQILSDGKLWEVEIDGTTGEIVEVEQEDDDEDDDDGDDD